MATPDELRGATVWEWTLRLGAVASILALALAIIIALV